MRLLHGQLVHCIYLPRHACPGQRQALFVAVRVQPYVCARGGRLPSLRRHSNRRANRCCRVQPLLVPLPPVPSGPSPVPSLLASLVPSPQAAPSSLRSRPPLCSLPSSPLSPVATPARLYLGLHHVLWRSVTFSHSSLTDDHAQCGGLLQQRGHLRPLADFHQHAGEPGHGQLRGDPRPGQQPLHGSARALSPIASSTSRCFVLTHTCYQGLLLPGRLQPGVEPAVQRLLQHQLRRAARASSTAPPLSRAPPARSTPKSPTSTTATYARRPSSSPHPSDTGLLLHQPLRLACLGRTTHPLPFLPRLPLITCCWSVAFRSNSVEWSINLLVPLVYFDSFPS